MAITQVTVQRNDGHSTVIDGGDIVIQVTEFDYAVTQTGLMKKIRRGPVWHEEPDVSRTWRFPIVNVIELLVIED